MSDNNPIKNDEMNKYFKSSSLINFIKNKAIIHINKAAKFSVNKSFEKKIESG